VIKQVIEAVRIRRFIAKQLREGPSTEELLEDIQRRINEPGATLYGMPIPINQQRLDED
jgi:hypothetical protein